MKFQQKFANRFPIACFFITGQKVTDYKKFVAEGSISRKADTAVRNFSDARVIAVTGRQRSHISTINKRPNERPLSKIIYLFVLKLIHFIFIC